MSAIKTLRSAVLALTATISAASFAPQASAQGWFNPEIYNSGRQVTDARYDPFTGQIIVRTDQTKVRESYLNPNRNQIDPGSFRNVNRYETDMNGVRWHVTGTQWTSGGTPHGNLSRRRIGGGRGPVVEDRNEHVAFSATRTGGSSNVGGQNPGVQRSAKPPISNPTPRFNRGGGSSRSGNRSYSPF